MGVVPPTACEAKAVSKATVPPVPTVPVVVLSAPSLSAAVVFFVQPVGAADGSSTTGATGGGGSHVHGGSTFSGTAIDLNVKFYDVIIAAKD